MATQEKFVDSFEDITHPLLLAMIKEHKKAAARNYDRVYYAFDIHDTMMESNYAKDKKDIPKEFFPGAIPTLKLMHGRPDFRLIISSSSPPDHIVEYRKLLESHGISFDYVNENPEVDGEHFEKKYYVNVINDDKAGFTKDLWPQIEALVKRLPVLKGKEKVYGIGVAVMRIQGPFGPTEGHKHFLKEVFRQGKKVLICLSSAWDVSERNPLGFDERALLLEKWIREEGFGDRNYRITELANKRWNQTWVHILDDAIGIYAKDPGLTADQVALFHSRDGFGRHYVPYGKFSIVEVPELPGVSATNVREELRSFKVTNADQVIGMCVQQLRQSAKQLLQTRGICETPSGKIALVKYSDMNEAKYRFLGGYFVPAKDKNLRESLKRKLAIKTTYLDVGAEFRLVDIIPFEDWRYRESSASIQCAVFRTSVDESIAKNPAYRSAIIEEIRFADKSELAGLLDEEELCILPFIS